ncbi:MAG TPA: 6-phosphogluconolactonase [Pyrinomonadaceae bacterium]|jgi:6-phosphogluconolactonase
MPHNIIISENLQALSRAAAEIFVRIGGEAIERNNRFTVALSGGSTPKLLFKILAGDEFRSQINWTKTFFFFGDERHVKPNSAESNYRMARKNLFEPLKIPAENVYRWRAEWQNAEEIALDYEKTLTDFFKTELPRFDLILLGMGADGHTASLFPETSALIETQKLAVANWVKKLDSFRLTLTFPLINNAANIIFLVGGAEKAEMLKTVLEGEFEPQKFPAQNVNPRDGNLFWLIEKEAARLLSAD